MNIDLYILTFSALTVIATIWMGFRSAKKSKTASDFFVAGRSVSVGWNASAISGEYLSAASFMGIAGMVMSSGYDALWYPVCYACGYLFLLLFIAGPLRRFGAYTIPDFAEGRFDSPLFRKIAVVFVLFIGFFYTMPQMKGAGTTLAYIFQDIDLRGVLPGFLLGNDPGGHPAKGLPYWAGVVLVGAVITLNVALGGMKGITLVQAFQYWAKMFAISVPVFVLMAVYGHYGRQLEVNDADKASRNSGPTSPFSNVSLQFSLAQNLGRGRPTGTPNITDLNGWIAHFRRKFATTKRPPPASPSAMLSVRFVAVGLEAVLPLYGDLKGKTVLVANIPYPTIRYNYTATNQISAGDLMKEFEVLLSTNGIDLISFGDDLLIASTKDWTSKLTTYLADFGFSQAKRRELPAKAPADATWLNPFGPLTTKAAKNAAAAIGRKESSREGAKDAKASDISSFAHVAPSRETIPLRSDITTDQHLTVALDSPTVAQALAVYAELTGRKLVPNTNSFAERVDDLLDGKLSQLKLIARGATPDSGVRFHNDGVFTAGEVKAAIEQQLRTNGLELGAVGSKGFEVVPRRNEGSEVAARTPSPTSPLRGDSAAEKAWLAKHEKPLALLYTYSLIIAIVCGTAGLPHILVRFYTNPDGVAAKRTTMWVMILIGVFYLFPPVFGVIGRNLMPELYAGAGAKGTDKIVLELPRILNAKYAPLGSILSGITCAGAFAAFMSTFSGLLVSMTGALAHDVYGRMLRPKSTPEQRLRMFKIGAVILGAGAIIAGTFVEQLQINFMVGQAFAIAAASYFPLLFMAVWWRKLTMKGAATGMLAGGLLALTGISLTSFSDLQWIDLADFWAANPLMRILCEQPAIWAVPLAIALMIVVSKFTAREVPGDIRMKMLVLHAPEQLGLKQEYIQEHQPH